MYVKFSDGTAFCRSVSGGPLHPAEALYFTPSSTDAAFIQKHGGKLETKSRPAVGLYPIYGEKAGVQAVGATDGKIVFQPQSFRIGTVVKTIKPA